MSALLLLLPRPLYLPTTDHCRRNTTFVVPKGEAMLRCFTYFAQKHVERLRDFLTFMPKIYSLCYKSFPKTYPSLSSVFPSSTHLRCMIISANWTKNGQGMFFYSKAERSLYQVWEAHSYSAHENIFRANCCSCVVVYQAKLTTNNEGSNPWHIRKVNLC